LPRAHATIDRYARSRQIDLARSIADRAKIYLDVRFWIIVREVAAGTETGPAARKLLHLLRRGVSQGALVCPISESTFIEVMKQANTPTRRIATARLIDELSLGVSIINSRSRIATEIGHFFYAALSEPALHPMQDLVWTKLSYALGYVHPSLPEIDGETELALQKGFFDKMWNLSLSQIVHTIGDNWAAEGEELPNSARQINTDIKAHAGSLVSYPAAYRDEIIGVLDVSADLAADAMAGMAERAGVTPTEPGSPAWTESGRMCRNLLIAAFEKPTTRNTLRTIHALASFHAGLRWDRNTNFTANDFFDFEHAAAAVAYCDAFFTEGFLAQIANAGQIRLCDLNPCRITKDIDAAVEIVRALASRRANT
jgi:hypothetical protein